MRYRLHEIDRHHVVATTIAADRDEALEWFSEKLRLMLSFEGDPADADYLLDEWPEGLLAHTANPTIPVLPHTLRHHGALELVRSVFKTRPRMGFSKSAAGHKHADLPISLREMWEEV